MRRKKRTRYPLLILILLLGFGIYYRESIAGWAEALGVKPNTINNASSTAKIVSVTPPTLVSSTTNITAPAMIVTSTSNPAPAPLTFSSKKLAGTNSFLLEFGTSDFKRARDARKLIVFYFYSDLDALARDEYPEIIDAFNQLSTDQVVGFKINMSDDISESEFKITQDFNIATSNTKIFLKENREVLRSTESWDQQEYLNQFAKTLTDL